MQSQRGNKTQKNSSKIRTLLAVAFTAAIAVLLISSRPQPKSVLTWWTPELPDLRNRYGFFLTLKEVPPLDTISITALKPASGRVIFRNGRHVSVQDGYKLPTEQTTLKTDRNIASIEPFWTNADPNRRKLDAFVPWYSRDGDHTVSILRFYWPEDTYDIHTKELSGVQWVRRYPTSKSTTELYPEFRKSVDAFLAALREAGAYVRINATYRPPERAYIMHCAYRIARRGLDPRTVPYMAGVDIHWVHTDSRGRADLAASKRAAEQMTTAYKIAYPAALFSPHIERRAIDMTISWSGNLNIRDTNGQIITITSGPKNGDNPILHKVGRTYGVHKFVADPPHWQDTPIPD